MRNLNRINQPIKAILFDLDGTLRFNHPNANDVLLDQAVTLGIADNIQKRKIAARWAHYYWAQSPELYADYQEHTNDAAFWTKYIQRYLTVFGCSEVQAGELATKLMGYMKDAYKPENRLADEIHPTLQALKDSGYTLGLVSNRSNPVDELLEELGINAYFDFSFVAGDIQIWKPKRGIFIHALNLAGSSAPNTIYVGDNYYSDILGARNAGLIPVLYDENDLFPEAECTIIKHISDLKTMLID